MTTTAKKYRAVATLYPPGVTVYINGKCRKTQPTELSDLDALNKWAHTVGRAEANNLAHPDVVSDDDFEFVPAV